MNLKMLTTLLAAVLLGFTSALFVGANSENTPEVSPTLKVDPSPVSEGSTRIETSYADIVEPVQEAVVSVYSTKIVAQRVPTDPFSQLFGGGSTRIRERKEEGLGSGVIISTDGFIITNNHVIEGADELSVMLPDDREYSATLIGSDPKTDIAVIKIDAKNLPTVTLADSDKLRVGDVVFAMGNPLGVGQTVTMGIVSAKGRNKLGLLENVEGYEDFIQTDASINMGNSGGALIDAKGRLVGINSAIVSNTRGSIGIGFAIPVNLAAAIMHSLINTGTVSRGYLGVSAESVTPEIAESLSLPDGMRGVAITDITPSDGPAAVAGLQRTDVIYAINTREVTSLEDLRLLIAQSAPGSEVKLHLIRDGEELVVPVILGQRDDLPNELLAGVEAIPLSDDLRRQLNVDLRVTGLVVTEVSEDSPYANRLLPNIVIVEINRTEVTDVTAAREQFKQGRNLLLVYYRGVYRYLTVQVD
jgi:serine protease Do/serine protease DegQ